VTLETTTTAQVEEWKEPYRGGIVRGIWAMLHTEALQSLCFDESEKVSMHQFISYAVAQDDCQGIVNFKADQLKFVYLYWAVKQEM
jgi:hypothetical protein